MKEIIDFLKQRRNLKYSLWIIVFGLIFIFTFQANRAQISQIPREPIKIELGTKGARKHLLSGWSRDQRWEETTILWARGRESRLQIFLPKKETYRLTVKAFSSSPPGFPNQVVEIRLNDLALDRWELKKTSEWQKFSLTIPSFLVSEETNFLKFVYSEDTSLFPIAFDYLKFKNYFARLYNGLTLHLLYDSPIPREPLFIKLFFYSLSPQGTFSFKVLGYSLVFLIFFFFFSLFSARLISSRARIELSKGFRLDLFTYLPSLVLLSLFALVSLLSPYNIVYSLKTFFILSIAPTIAIKTWFIYKDRTVKTIKLHIRTTPLILKRIWAIIKRTLLAIRSFPLDIKTFRKFLIQYHKTNLSSAFILDFMLLLVLCAFLLMVKAEWIAKQLANLAYFLLVFGVIMKAIQFFKESKKR